MDLNSLKKQISDISSRSKHVFDAASSKPELDDIYRSFLGKKGEVNLLLKSLGSLPQDKRKDAGLLLNKLKEELESLYTSTSQTLIARANSERLAKDSVDVTLPGFQSYKGSLHPVSQTIKEISDFFERMGFDIETGPEAEIDYYNFEALNVPEDHPAKDMHDTFYLSNSGLLRTHTSPVQIRTMEKSEPPHRIICPGKVYRKDSDLTHTPMFHQIEGLVVEKDASFAQLKGLLNDFLEDFFGEKVELRFRPSYFPFTEPSAEADIRWKKNWLEVLGCGMVHPNVLEGVGVDTKEYSGFAFGLGVERMAMLKYDIPDLRAFFENDLRFLKQF
ncbi:MAG: phenylalanine--tRNA ligase subunit alpha [Gammaproteobacteria bacterium]|jgi:phenylalanyl-tRNA synthetase alpha chain|nr:phenylalanine--tRNA ligase subunit alpha [Gammaproteobacteria bacterium]|tara:strand:- start:860 stop:1855 length:996 start_codon:yes stop_codon:yes gene_type:complete